MKPEPCSECGSTTWLASLVDDRGVRTCLDCLTGRTAMKGDHITIPTGGRLETAPIEFKRPRP